MPQQLLHDFELCTHASQQRRIGVTKCVPADPFLDSNSLGDWTNMLAQDCLSPVWLPSPIASAGKNPVVRLRGDTLLPPLQKGVGEKRMYGYWLLRRFGLTRAGERSFLSISTKPVSGQLPDSEEITALTQQAFAVLETRGSSGLFRTARCRKLRTAVETSSLWPSHR